MIPYISDGACLFGVRSDCAMSFACALEIVNEGFMWRCEHIWDHPSTSIMSTSLETTCAREIVNKGFLWRYDLTLDVDRNVYSGFAKIVATAAR